MNHKEIPKGLIRIVNIKNLDVLNVGGDVELQKLSSIVGGNVT